MQNKTNYSYVGIAFIVLVFGIIFIPKIINRISNKDVLRSDESRSQALTANIKNKSDLAYISINGIHKKVPEFSFTNQHGKTITQKDYIGKVYVVEFFYTTCPTICPIMNRNLVAVQNQFKHFDNFGVASFTINPDIDTPEVLNTYAKNYGITNPHWHFLTGAEAKIYELSNKGFNLFSERNDAVEGGFEHSGNFALIDKQGYLRSRTDDYGNPIIFYNGLISEEEGKSEEGIPQEITILKEDIAKLLNETYE